MGRDSELISLVKAGNTEGVKKFLVRLRKSGSAKKLATINSQNEEGLSALHLCALQNLKELLEELLELKASVNLKDSRGLTPLHYTAFRGNLEAAVSLMDYQANPCAVANNGETPLHVSAQYGHANVMSVLLDYQANPLISNNTAQTPLDIACFMGHTKAVRVLLDTGCFPSKQYGSQSLVQSPIHLCAKQGHTEILKMLVEAGFSVDEMGPNGTPLHEAALYGRVDVVKLLIQMRCDQNLKNSQSQTAMDLVHKFTNPRAYTSRQILQALSQARPVSIPRPPSFTMSNVNLNPPPSPSLSSHSFHSLPDNQHPAHSDSGSMDTPVRDRNADFHPQEADPELLASPLPTYNEYEAPGEANGFASMIAQAAVLRKNTLTNPSRKISNNYIPPMHQHVPSDPMDRLACVKSSKRESFSNSSTDTSFSFTSNSGFSTGVSTPDRYQSPSPANLPLATQAQMPQQHRQAFQAELPSNDTYDVPDDCQLNQPTYRVGDATLVHNIYDTPSSIPKSSEFAPQGDARYAPKPPRPNPADIARSNTDNSMVLRKLTLPAGFNNLSDNQQQPIYDNQTTPDEILPPNYPSQQPVPAFQAPHPVDSMELPPRPLSKPRILAKPGLTGAVNSEEKQHLSELQMKLSMRKKVSETSLRLPPAPPSTSPPSMATQSDFPPQKPPREMRVRPVSPPSPPPEERAPSPEVESQFLEALKLRKGSLKRTDKIAPFVPPQNTQTPPPLSTNPIPPQPVVTNQIPPQSVMAQPSPPKPLMTNPIPPQPVVTNPIPPQPVVTNQIPPQPLFKNPKPPPSISTNPGPSIPEVSLLETESREPRKERSGTIISKISPSESWPLDRFLSALKLSEYLATLVEAGYAESADLVGLTADDVTAAGIVKAGHRKKILTSTQSLTARHAGFDHIPSSIESWLRQWRLLEHQHTLVDSGYDDLEFIADMTRDELRELGIHKAPVLDRFSHALSHLHACIQTHRSVVLSASPQVTPQKPSSSVKHSQQPNPTQECAKPPVAKPPADFTPPPAHTRNSPLRVNTSNAAPVNREIFTRDNTQEDPAPTDNFTPHAQLSKTISNPPSVLRKPTLPPPVSRKPPPQRRHSKNLNSPDQLASPPSPNQLISPPSPDQLISPPDALVGLDDLPPPPIAVRSSVYGDLQDDLPPPPQEMSSLGAEANFTPPHIPPPPPVATTPVSRFLAAESAERHKRISGISDLDDILNSMGSEATTPPDMSTHTPNTQRPIQSSEVLEDIDAMLANLNLEIDSIISDT